MKRVLLCVFLILLSFELLSCSNTPSKDEAEISNDNPAIVSGGWLEHMLDCFKRIQDSGDKLFACFEGFDSLEESEKYDAIKEAEDYTKEMAEEYEEILTACSSDSEYEPIEIQTKLMQNLIPRPVDNNATAISNAAVLYQLFFQQLSSSFGMISRDLDALSKGENIKEQIGYFEDMPKMLRPDTVILDIGYLSKKVEGGVVQYTYSSGKDSVDARLNYNLYLIAIGMDTGLEVSFDDTMAYVFDGEDMVSALMAGNDDEIGNFFIVSFPQK